MNDQKPTETRPGSNGTQSENKAAPEKKTGRKFLRAALFFAGSAAFGGLAVALWDRKTLSSMHRKAAEPSTPPDQDADIY
jgi:hypothetical protein